MKMKMKMELNFIQGNECKFESDNIQDDNKLAYLKTYFEELMNTPNINFLLGSGTSANAIPTMANMQKAVEETLPEESSSEYDKLRDHGKKNLEQILGYLYSYQSYLKATNSDNEKNTTCELISFIEKTIFEKINVQFNQNTTEEKDTLKNYETFYQKITHRSIDLARVNIFTTNNDLFNETSMDNLNINFNNGFSGGLTKYFNPAQFNSVLANKVDLNLEKYQPIENLVNLYKLHGSINWIEDNNSPNKFFNIQEIKEPKSDNINVLVYPTPLKQNQSLGSPYADLMREFQKKLLLPNNVLIIIGFSMSDEHINNIIYQSLTTNSSLNVVILGNPAENNILGKLKKINDPRVLFIWGFFKNDSGSTPESPDLETKIHYFQYIVENLIPTIKTDKEKELLKNFNEKLKEDKK